MEGGTLKWLGRILDAELAEEFASIYQLGHDDKDRQEQALFRYRLEQQQSGRNHRVEWLRVKANPERLAAKRERNRLSHKARYREKHLKTTTTSCAWCKQPFVQPVKQGRPRVYCSPACTQKGSRVPHLERDRRRFRALCAKQKQARKIEQLRRVLLQT